MTWVDAWGGGGWQLKGAGSWESKENLWALIAPPLPGQRASEGSKKELLVLDLDGRHLHQVRDELRLAEGGCVFRSLVVLADVLSLELPGEVHREKPTGEAAKKRERMADDARADF